MAQSHSNRAYEEAVRFKDTQQYWMAVNYLKEAISYNPQRSDFYEDLGYCFMKLGCYQDALYNCRRAVELTSKKTQIYENMAVELEAVETGIFFLQSYTNVDKLERVKKYEEEIQQSCNNRNIIKSLSYLNKCLIEFPKCVRYKFMKAELLIYIEEYEESAAILEKIEDNSSKSIYINGLMHLYYKCDLQQAIQCFENILSKELSCTQIYKKAQQYYEIAKSLKFLKEEGNVCFASGRYKEARQFYTQGLHIDPYAKKINAILHFNTALALNAETSKYKAIYNLTNAIGLNPMYQKAYLKRAEIFLDLSNFQNAIKDYEIGLTMNENVDKNVMKQSKLKYFEAYLMRIQFYIGLDNFEYAIKDCENVYKMDFVEKNRCDLYYMKALLKRAQHFKEIMNYEQAMNDFKKAFQMNCDEMCLKQYENSFSVAILQQMENLLENSCFHHVIRQYEEIFHGDFKYKFNSTVLKNCESVYVRALMNRADHFTNLKKFDLALREYEIIFSSENIAEYSDANNRYLKVLLVRAQHYFDCDDFALCIKEFETIFALSSPDSELLASYKHIYIKALLSQMQINFGLENFHLCTKIYENALDLNLNKKEKNILNQFEPKYLKILLDQAKYDSEHANFANAINIYKKILKINDNMNDLDQNYVDILLKRGNFYLSGHKYEEAIEDFDEIYKKRNEVNLPDNFEGIYFEALSKMIQIYTNSGNVQESFNCYLKISQLEHIDKNSLTQYTDEILKIGELFVEDGKYEKAEHIYEKLCIIDNCERNKNLFETVKYIPIILNAKDYYKILNVDKNATDEDVKRAYYKQSKLHHPDKHNKCSEKRIALQNDIFKIIMKAYTVLSDPIKRAEYDRQI